MKTRLLALALLCAATPAAGDTLSVKTIASQGQVSPIGGFYLLFGEMDVDPLRRISYTASISNGRVGLFRRTLGITEVIVLTGDPAPPEAGNAFFVPTAVAGNTRGDLAFISTLAFPRRAGVFLRRDGEFTTLALEGSAAPGHADLTLGPFDQIRLLDSGEVYVVAWLRDAEGVFAGRALFAHDGVGLRAVLPMGLRYGGARAVGSLFQYEVNASGEVAALIEVTDPLFLEDRLLTEVVLLSGGRLRTLASKDLPISGGIDLVRQFASTFDQVRLDDNGSALFFASTNDFLGGGYFINPSGSFMGNFKLTAQGDPSPLSATDRMEAFGAFARSAKGTLVFHAATSDVPQGAIFVQAPGSPPIVAAQAGSPRPAGGNYPGFLRVDMNQSGDALFSDFTGIIQVGIHLARLVPPSTALVDRLLEASEPFPDLMPFMKEIALMVVTGDEGVRQRIAAVRTDIRFLVAGKVMAHSDGQRLDLLLEDLLDSLGPAPAAATASPLERTRVLGSR